MENKGLTDRQLKRMLIKEETQSEVQPKLTKESEEKEISSQLASIKKKYDKLKDQNSKKKQQLKKLKLEIQEVNTWAKGLEEEKQNYREKQEQLQSQLKDVQLLIEEEEHNQKVYRNMLERNKKEQLRLDKQSSKLYENLRSAKMILNKEKEKSLKSQEDKFESVNLARRIQSSMEDDQKKQERRLEMLEKTMQMQRDLSVRREERFRRQANIAEKAANEDRAQQENRYLESLLLHKFYYLFLKRKLENEKRARSNYEEAFQHIKQATGLGSLDEIVEKFLTREETYNELLISVNEAEVNLEELKSEYDGAKQKLKELSILHEKNSFVFMDKDYFGVEKELYSQQRDYETKKSAYYRTSKVYNDSLEWASKMLSEMGGAEVGSSLNLKEVFDLFEEKLAQLIEEAQKDPEFQKRLKSYTQIKQVNTKSLETGIPK